MCKEGVGGLCSVLPTCTAHDACRDATLEGAATQGSGGRPGAPIVVEHRLGAAPQPASGVRPGRHKHSTKQAPLSTGFPWWMTRRVLTPTNQPPMKGGGGSSHKGEGGVEVSCAVLGAQDVCDDQPCIMNDSDECGCLLD